MMRIISPCLLVVALAVSLFASDEGRAKKPDSLAGIAYIIDPVAGDDANPAGKPWRSFAKLNATVLAPGDTVEIAPGRHEGTLRPVGAGTADRPITLRFRPGIHTIGMEGIVRLPLFVSNACDSPAPKPIGILLQNLRHVRLEGGGVAGADKTSIVYDGRMVQILNDHSEGITFTGLVLDLKRPTVSEFRILEEGARSAVLQVAEGSDYSIENGRFRWQGDWGPGNSGVEGIPEEGRLWRRNAPRGWTANGQEEAIATDLGGRRVRLDYPSDGTGLVAGHQYGFRSTKRDSVGIHSTRSKDIVFQDCDIYALTGMGLVSQFTENLTFRRVNVAPPKGSLRTCAAWADIFQFSNCRGSIVVEDCRLSGMQDDAVNCHGTYLRILEKTRENQVLVAFMHRQTYGFAAFAPGDEVAVINHQNLREYADNSRRRVIAVEPKSEKEWLVTLDGPVPHFAKEDVLDNITWYPELTLRNNHVSMDVVRGFLITNRGRTVVENNVFHRCKHPGILIENGATGWFESGPIRDLLIRGNRFVECDITIKPVAAVFRQGEPIHENIRIEDNVFEGAGIEAKGVGGLTIVGNKSTPSPLRIQVDPSCSEVRIRNEP